MFVILLFFSQACIIIFPMNGGILMKGNRFDAFCEKTSLKQNAFSGKLYSAFCRADNQINSKQKLNVAIIAAVSVLLFAVMLFLNYCTPYLNDDYIYFNIFSENGIGDFILLSIKDQKVENLSDIVESMKAHYNVMNGRILVHSIVQGILILPKSVFNVLNSAAYVALMLLIYKHCKGTCREHKAVLFVLICLAAWTFLPDFGKTALWLTGSINYLWSSVFRLAVLLPFRLYADGKNDKVPWLKAIVMTLACLAAGATNENTSAAFIGVTVLFMIYCRVHKRKLPVWSVTGLIAALCGFFFMVSAPGNSRRVNIGDEVGNSIATRLVNIPANMILFLSVFVGAFVVCVIILYTYDRESGNKKTGIAAIALIGAFGAAAVMVASPQFPTRAWFGIYIYAMTAVGILVYRILLNENLARRLILISVMFWSIWSMLSCVHTAQDMKGLHSFNVKRDAYIEEQKAQGNYDLELEKYYTTDKHAPSMDGADITEDPEHWRNITFAMHYGLDSVKEKK